MNLPHLQMPQSSSSGIATPSMLSPLQISSSGSFKASLPSSTPESPIPVASTSKLPFPTLSQSQKTNGVTSAKGKERQQPEDLLEPPHLNEMALHFVRRSLLVKTSFKHWLGKTSDRRYEEAHRRNEEYKERLYQERLTASMSSVSSLSRDGTPPKRRRMSVDGVAETIQAKRKKRRMSSDVEPLDDDALVRQFREVCVPVLSR